MSTVAEFTIRTEDFALGELFEALPQVTVELERVVPTGTGVVPYLWISDVERRDIESVFETHPAVDSMQVVDSVDDQHLLRATWRSERNGILRVIADSGVTLLAGSGTAVEWTFEVRADHREDIAAFQKRCRDGNIPITLVGIQGLNANRTAERYGLTTAQREALRLAYERGYFDDDRQTTLEAIATDLGISRQALAARLRRGHRNLIRTTIVRA